MSYALLTISNATSGDYLLQTSATDFNFDPLNEIYSGDAMCDISASTRIRLYSLTVADGGSPCFQDEAWKQTITETIPG